MKEKLKVFLAKRDMNQDDLKFHIGLDGLDQGAFSKYLRNSSKTKDLLIRMLITYGVYDIERTKEGDLLFLFPENNPDVSRRLMDILKEDIKNIRIVNSNRP